MSKIIAAYGGGFKPPTAGHFEVVKTALGKHPEIDEFIIYIGSGERDGISQDEAILVWDIFANYLPMKVQIEPSNGPIGDIIRLGKNNPGDEIYFVIGGRDGNEGDMKDIATRTKNIEAAYPNMKVKVITTPDKGMSGTNARKAAKKSEEKLSKFLPVDLTPEEKLEVFNIIRPVVKEMISEEIPNDVINSFDIQDTLVKNVWVDGELQPEIREKLLKIAQDFFDSLELPEGTILKDIKLTGSFANFNWSKFSDVDLHLVLDFSEISDNEEFAKDYFMAKKNLWNNAHDIDIYGYPVEVYVEDKDEPHTASGLYSILNDEWITIPQQQKIIIDKDDIKSKAEGYLSLIPQFEKMFEDGKYKEVINSIDKTKERIRDMRSSGLEKGGLYSVENLAFKVLRRSDFVKELNDLKTNSYDAMMSLNEDISKSQLDSIEGYADKLFAKLGIDIEFTRHFLDRLNDKRNNKPISVAELMGIFKRLHRKHGKPLSRVNDDFNAVVKDFNNNINIPFAINVTDDDIEMYAKTVMRKKDFKTSTPVIALNENATYTKKINLIDRLATLTQHMLDKGMNIEPLPKLEFKDGDSENASEFLGKTAYYDPNTQTIVLYTEGRHPKDITRSYAHEMIHHIQNLEGRLGDIQTTNTQEDDHLKDIEAEANLKGTMTFRNWTDSLDEEESLNEVGEGTSEPFSYEGGNITFRKGGSFAYIINGEVRNEDGEEKVPIKLQGIAYDERVDDDMEMDRPEFYEFLNEPKGTVLNGFEVIFSHAGDSSFGLVNDVKFMFRLMSTIKEILQKEFASNMPNLLIYSPNKKGSEQIEDTGRHRLYKAFISKAFPKAKMFTDDRSEEIIFKLKESLDEDNDPCWDTHKIGSPKTKISTKTNKRVNNCVPKNENKDPFGLTKMVKEILIHEEEVVSSPPMEYKIYSDMDGVLTDFDDRFKKYSNGVMPSSFEKRYGKDKFWELIDNEGVAYWVGMPWMEDGKKYWDYIKDLDTELLSSPSRSETSRLGKRLWVRNNMPGVKLHLAQSFNKKNYAEPNHILIDDRPSNISQWVAAGGIGILHRTADETIRQLKKLGL